MLDAANPKMLRFERDEKQAITMTPGEFISLDSNGLFYKHWLFGKLLHRQHVKHRFTRPSTPRANGKAERFLQTALRQWGYARAYQNSAERETQLDLWLHDYNFHRPHDQEQPLERPQLER